MLTIRLLGDMQILRGGVAIELPRSRKARALLALLVATGQTHQRCRLGELLWGDTEDPRGSLRWNLSLIRALTEAGERPLLTADRDTVRFDPQSAEVDLTAVRRLVGTRPASATVEQLQRAVGLFRGPFLDGLDIPDSYTFRAWCVAEREEAHGAHVLLRLRLADLLGASDAALANARALVAVDSRSEEAWSRLIDLLSSAGRRREALQQYETACRALRGEGGLRGKLLNVLRTKMAGRAASPSPVPLAATVAATDAPRPSQGVRFSTMSDGVRIAHASAGVGPPLVMVGNWTTHLEHDWQSPVWSHWFRELSRGCRLLRYDQRANGLSDWDVDDLSFDALVRDLETIIDASGQSRVALLGISQGCAVAAAYAARHPLRVSHLVFCNGFATGWTLRAADDAARRRAIGDLLEQGWAQDNPAVRQLFTSLLVPDATHTQMQHFNELLLKAISAANVARLHHSFGRLDIRGLLPHVRSRTLVLHSRDDSTTPFEAGRHLAAAIPDARFVALDSRNHILLEHDPAWPGFLAEVRRFLAADAA